MKKDSIVLTPLLLITCSQQVDAAPRAPRPLRFAGQHHRVPLYVWALRCLDILDGGLLALHALAVHRRPPHLEICVIIDGMGSDGHVDLLQVCAKRRGGRTFD